MTTQAALSFGRAAFFLVTDPTSNKTTPMDAYHFSTGIPSLDKILRGILPGDNVVW